MTVIKKVLGNNVQALTDAEKAQARKNIGTNRVVFVTYGISTKDEISSAVSNGDSVILIVPETSHATYVPLSYTSSAGYVFRSPVSSEKFVEYSVYGSTWTRTEKPYRNEWVSFTPDPLQTTVAKKIFAIGGIEFGYYFDNNASFRLAMRSTSGTRSVYLDDNRGFGREYSVTTDWKLIESYGFSNSNQQAHFKGYDTTGNVNLDFDVYFVITGSSTTVAQYRINL